MNGCAVSERHRYKKWKIIPIAVCGVFAVLFLITAVYLGDYYHSDQLARNALVTDDIVQVNQTLKDMILFLPKEPVAGFIFYPGGKVEYTAMRPCFTAWQSTDYFVCWSKCRVIWQCLM